MIGYPKTKEQAMKIRYGQWAGNMGGNKYKPEYCAYEVWQYYSRQCSRKNGHGSDGLYCKQHAKILEDTK